MTPLNVYMVMVSFRASGAEPRFANIMDRAEERRTRPTHSRLAPEPFDRAGER